MKHPQFDGADVIVYPSKRKRDEAAYAAKFRTSPIYVITALSSDNLMACSTRCFGFFHEEAEAIKAVEENRCDMHESYYIYLAISKVDPGIHAGMLAEDRWYEFGEDTWVPIKTPEKFQHIHAIGMG